MNGLKKIIALAIVSVMLFACFACNDEITRPEPSVTLAQVVYPEYPSEKPAAPAEGVEPSVTGFYASKTAAPENAYSLTEESDGVAISYADVENYAYIYAPVENYSPKYGNIKITIENLTPAAENVGIQAIYYEAKELGYPPVTVFIDSLIEGEQYLVSELKDFEVLDGTYNVADIEDASLRNKTIIGFVIFIDSLPSFAPKRDTIGSCKIKKFEFLTDEDPRLQDRYVVPDASLTNATAEDGITLNAGETLSAAASDAGGEVLLPVSRYSADFAEYTLTAKGTGSAEIGVCYKLAGDKTARYSEAMSVTLSGEDDDYVYNFVNQFAVGETDDIKTTYVRGGTITDVYIKLSASASIEIGGVKFTRTVNEKAPYVTNAWNGCSGATVERATTGGNAKLAVEHYTGWNYVSVGVKKAHGVKKIIYTIYAPDGLGPIGIAVLTDSQLRPGGQPVGQYVLRNAWGLATTESGQFTKALELAGVTETIAYDDATKIYTYTYDFTNMEKDSDNKTFADYTVNRLLFYLNDPGSLIEDYEGARSVYFMSIELIAE